MSSRFTVDLLILDYGGVYSFDYDPGSLDTIMQNTFGKAPEAEEKQQIESLSHRLATDQISSCRYVRDVAHILRTQTPSAESFEENTIAVTHNPSPEMVELVALVKKSSLRVALLSNMYMFEVTKTRPWGRYDNFDHVAFSAEAQLTKSDPEFLLRTIDHFGVSPTRTLFVDDVKANVQTAQTLGVQTIHADKAEFSNAQDLADLILEKIRL